MHWKDLLQSQSRQLLAPALVITVTLIIGLVARRLIFAALTRWARKTTSQMDDIIVGAIRGPFLIWVLMLSIHLAAQFSALPDKVNSVDCFADGGWGKNSK
jgi:uncharacterized BrkB/YihY/UPF0761 family membrane protein